MVQGSRQWHEKLPFALLGYRTTGHTSTGETPYLLVYGTEAVIPAEVEIPSLRVIVEAEIDDDEWVKTRLEYLNLIEEKRLTSVCHGQLYQRRMARAYNKKVRPRNFEVGQLVLRRILPHQVEAKGKFSPNWQGPFVVKKMLPNGALYLTDIEGKMAEMAINADAVKRYYVSSGMGSRILGWGYRIRVEDGLGVLRLLVLSWIIVVHCLGVAIEEEGGDKWAGSV
ncbi:hypothetical protein CQW23_34022 [Capsicum baccatum]|uniref:Uncharacterized protein n=1 Tax=Capsicum baccatum TaxID=33114 RepID=A0A2G2V070_CAPBA|nr:hypothetical protein CQW23_34022 [Capsicum baccatum]